MKVMCTSKDANALGIFYPTLTPTDVNNLHIPLTVGKTYVVYALAIKDGQILYYLCDDDDLYYPKSWPASLFHVSDQRLSSCWVYAFTPKHLDHNALFAFREWTSDPYFYDRLTDGAESERSIFERMKMIMIEEATS